MVNRLTRFMKNEEFYCSNEIYFVRQYRLYRATAVLFRFQKFFIDSPVGLRETLQASADYLNKLHIPLIDRLLVELNDRCSSRTLSRLVKSSFTICPSSANFHNIDEIDEFCWHICEDFRVY